MKVGVVLKTLSNPFYVTMQEAMEAKADEMGLEMVLQAPEAETDTEKQMQIVENLVVQQIDGNLIYPRVVGSSVGLPAIWILFAVTVGGGLFGVPGMLLGAPVFAVIYMLFADLVKAKLKKRDLPEDTETYVQPIDDFTQTYVQKPDIIVRDEEIK